MVIIQIEGQQIELPPDIAINDDAIRRALAPMFPAVANATLTRTDGDNGTTRITINKQAGSKNSYAHILHTLDQAPQHVNPIFSLHQQLCQHPDRIDSPETFFALHTNIDTVVEQGEHEITDTRAILSRLANTPGHPATRRPLAF